MSVYGGLVPLGFPHSNVHCGFILFICVDSLSYPHKKGNHFFLTPLLFPNRSAMLQMLSGETGASPVRVRRREVLDIAALTGVPQPWDKAIGFTEKAGR